MSVSKIYIWNCWSEQDILETAKKKTFIYLDASKCSWRNRWEWGGNPIFWPALLRNYVWVLTYCIFNPWRSNRSFCKCSWALGVKWKYWRFICSELTGAFLALPQIFHLQIREVLHNKVLIPKSNKDHVKQEDPDPVPAIWFAINYFSF